MSVPLYTSKLETIADALALVIAAAPVLAAEGCEVISRVDDTIGSQIEERVAKAGGLLCVIALQSLRPLQAGAPGPRVIATLNLSLWARRATRSQKNSGPVLFEALLAAVQNWEPADSLCYDQFSLVSGGQQPHPKFSLYEASISAPVQLAPPIAVP